MKDFKEMAVGEADVENAQAIMGNDDHEQTLLGLTKLTSKGIEQEVGAMSGRYLVIFRDWLDGLTAFGNRPKSFAGIVQTICMEEMLRRFKNYHIIKGGDHE